MVGTTRGKIAEGGPRPGFVEDATAPEGCHFTRLCPQTSSLPSLLSLNMVPLPCSWGLSTPLSGWKVGFPKTLVSTGLIQLSTDLTYGQIISDWRFRNLHHVLQPGTVMRIIVLNLFCTFYIYPIQFFCCWLFWIVSDKVLFWIVSDLYPSHYISDC